MKVLTAILISIIPINIIRIACYRLILGYKIDYCSKVGWLSVIVSETVEVTKSRIGNLNYISANRITMKEGSEIVKKNRIISIYELQMSKLSRINSNNRINGTPDGLTPYKAHEVLRLGERSNITSGHIIDLSDEVVFGSDVTLAGVGSQLWTHGFDITNCKRQAPITIADNVYFGSRVIVLPGVSICSYVSVGAGAVISKSIAEPGFYVSQPIIRKDTDKSPPQEIVTHNGYRFSRRSPKTSATSLDNAG